MLLISVGSRGTSPRRPNRPSPVAHFSSPLFLSTSLFPLSLFLLLSSSPGHSCQITLPFPVAPDSSEQRQPRGASAITPCVLYLLITPLSPLRSSLFTLHFANPLGLRFSQDNCPSEQSAWTVPPRTYRTSPRTCYCRPGSKFHFWPLPQGSYLVVYLPWNRETNHTSRDCRLWNLLVALIETVHPTIKRTHHRQLPLDSQIYHFGFLLSCWPLWIRGLKFKPDISIGHYDRPL
jgi:hypothetical protein